MTISAENRTTYRAAFRDILAHATPEKARRLPLNTHIELDLVRHLTACMLWAIEQRRWPGNGTVTSAMVEQWIWDDAADEDFMQDVPRDYHAAAFAEFRLECGLLGLKAA